MGGHRTRDGGGRCCRYGSLGGHRQRRLATPAPPFALETSVPVSSPQGDMRTNSVKRVAAAGEGAMSVPMIHRYLAAEG
jgi:thioredoxin reductase (NADPH)